jgi:adenylate cyclase
MFVDIRDFTAYAEAATPRELARVLGEYRRIVAGTVFAHGGTVDKFIGDGVMAVFGQPKPAPDDAHRALACATDLVRALDKWRLNNMSEGGPPLETGIGLHYGTVIGGVLESGFHDEFTVIGDAVNVAQRLESLAKSIGTPLVVSADLFAQIPDSDLRSGWAQRRKIKLTGRREPIDVFFVRRKAEPGETPECQDTDVEHSALHRSTFQSPPLKDAAPTIRV